MKRKNPIPSAKSNSWKNKNNGYIRLMERRKSEDRSLKYLMSCIALVTIALVVALGCIR